MFEQPIKGDLDRALSLLMHESRHKLIDQCNEIKSQAIEAGALQSNRVIINAAKAADTLHQDAMKQATPILLDFIDRMKREPAEITGWARPHLENLGNSLLGCIPPNGFPADHQRIRQQYDTVFQQRLKGVLRDVEIGFVKGAGFVGAKKLERKEEWISAAEAVQLLMPIMKPYVAQKTICTRAHSGLIRARAERFVVDGRAADRQEVPENFWWADGEAALIQNWSTGDFETWINHRVHLRAFGVSFLRIDVEKMVPAAPAEEPLAGSSIERRQAIILTALDVETRAVLRHLSDVHEETNRGTVFHVGRFREWDVAVAECGEGNVPAATTVDRGIGHFRPEVALFVGVAGGVKDVSIGDALISSKVYGYERGKDTAEGFKQRPVVNLPDYTLEQRARAIRLKEHWRARLDPGLLHRTPKIYIGAIAAGEKVVASSAGKIAEFIRDNYGDTLGIEMEGQGFLAGVHINSPVQGCIVRGISDLLEGKADADKAGSQKQAADVASAVAFEMLATLHPEEPERSLAEAKTRRVKSASPAPRTVNSAPSTSSVAIYFQPSETLAEFGEVYDKVEFTYPDSTGFYLRVIPKSRPSKPFTRAQLLQALRTAGMFAMWRQPSGLFAHNRYGAIVVEPFSHTGGPLSALTQVLENGEVWGIAKWLFVTNRPEYGNVIPAISFEQLYRSMLPRYVEFLTKQLKLPPPFEIRAGAVGLKGFRMTVPDGSYGPMYDDLFSGEYELADLSGVEIDRVLLEFFEEIFAATGYSRPDNLDGFGPVG